MNLLSFQVRTQFFAALQKSEAQGRVIRKLRDRERSTNSMISIIHAIYLLIILAPYEKREDIAIRPTDIAESGPVVVILARSSHICHPVHHAGTAKYLQFRIVCNVISTRMQCDKQVYKLYTCCTGLI